MQEKNCIILVKTDLLLHEKEFEALRECISHLDFSKVKSYDEFDYDFTNNKVTFIHPPYHPEYSNINYICDKVECGYILTNLNNLKKLLSL